MPPKSVVAPPKPPPPAAKKAPTQRASGAPGRGSVSLEEQLKRVSLRKVAQEEVHDSSSGAQKDAFDTAEAVAKYQLYVQRFNIERWLTALSDATFETVLVAISREEAQALILLYKESQKQEGCDEEQRAKAVAAVEAMARRLQKAMDGVMGPESPGCFVKTSMRSAKDQADPEAIRALFLSILGRLGHQQEEEEEEKTSENTKLVALSYASMELLCMQDARRVMDVFVGSERCWHDMELALAQASWEESLVARRWVHVEPDMEFRCFVSGGRLTAVSQYRHLACFPRLLGMRAAVLAGLTSFFEHTIKPRLVGVFPDDQYIVDLAVELEGATVENIMEVETASVGLRRWWCIEVNPFYETTDGCLFSWNWERAILEGRAAKKEGEEAEEDSEEGGVPSLPEFRLRERPTKGCLSLVYGKWKDALSGGLPE